VLSQDVEARNRLIQALKLAVVSRGLRGIKVHQYRNIEEIIKEEIKME
jgi:hypothetical protein